MTRWRPTPGLARSVIATAIGVAVGVVAGEPVSVVLAAPLVVVAALGLVHRPTSTPTVTSGLGDLTLHEGQGTVSRLLLTEGDDVEHVTRVATRARFVETHPASGMISALVDSADADLELSPRRWGRRQLAEERVALTTPWAGYRIGPVSLPGWQVRVLPETARYDSHAESPHPRGLVGAHRSATAGAGTEFAGIRAFQPGDRLRRINWRVTARTQEVHVTTSRVEQDAGLLLVVDAHADHGRSGGVDGAASSLDLTMRAAAALAQHAHGLGDRIGLRVIGGSEQQVGFGAGSRHLRRLLGTLADLQPGTPHDENFTRTRIRTGPGTTVVVLSPMLADSVATTAATMLRAGRPTLVIDTLPSDIEPGTREDADPRLAALAWRMRRIEREHVLAALRELGCPVMPWRGPGTIDDVLRRLARRAHLPRGSLR